MALPSKFSAAYLEMLRVGIEVIPHAKAIGLHIVRIESEHAWLSIPYDDKFVGNVETGVIHGGIITTLLDNACGLSVQLAMIEQSSIATLDLRIDYMKPATPGIGLLAHTHCYKLTRNIAFVRGTAYHTDEDDPIATCVGTFMLDANRIPPERAGALLQTLLAKKA